MLLASYTSTRPGIQGLANRAIRFRLRGAYSHTELVFEPGDGVGALMPDGSCGFGANGSLWCASSVAAEHMPSYSSRRSGRTGGVRFKRVVLDSERWDILPVTGDSEKSAKWFLDHQGALYDWQLVIGFLAWVIPQKYSRWSCSEAVAAALCFEDPARFDPCTLRSAIAREALFGSGR